MRWITGLVGCVLLGGCATQHSQVASDQPAPLQQADTPALALAFDPPLLANQPALYLDREAREPSAFVGYDQPTVTYSYLFSDDRYTFDHGREERDALTERIGVSTR